MINVFGSINLDMVFTPVNLPATGETVLCDSFTAYPGGKGANQAIAAASAGADVRMIGAVGNDSFADLPLSALTNACIDVSDVMRVDAPTGCASISVARDGQNHVVVASGANRLVSADQLRPEHLNPDDTLLLQMEVDYEQTWLAVKKAEAANMRILLNNAPAGPVPDAIMAKLSVLLVNEIESVQLASQLWLPATDPMTAAVALNESYGIDVVVTLGAQGAVAITDTRKIFVPAAEVDVVDTVGAGDAFCGALGAALDSGLALSDALAFASAAGGLTCQEKGAQASLMRRHEIETIAATLMPEIRFEAN